MLDIKFIKENTDLVKKGVEKKGVNAAVIDDLLHFYNEEYTTLFQQVQKLREESNKLNEQFKQRPTPEQIQQGRELKERLRGEEEKLRRASELLKEKMYAVPNLPKPDVKAGKDESENEVIRTVGTPKTFDFTPRDHEELGKILNIIDTETASEISGARFAYLKNEGALLEFALKQLAFEILLKEGFTPVIPPVLVRKHIMDDLGYTAMGEDENIYATAQDDLYLVGTSEQSIVPIYKNKVLDKSELPKRFAGFSTCFRREAGSYGKDTKGIFRVHQFDKVEMVSFVEQGKDDEEHEYLLSLEEKLFQMLEIPYQIVKVCTGDLGFNAARKYDIEAWIPSQNKYREVTSTSTVTDFQSRRLNMKYQDGSEKHYLNVLNGTAYSMNRPIIAILENYQQEDGSVLIPQVLQKYIGKEIIKPQK